MSIEVTVIATGKELDEVGADPAISGDNGVITKDYEDGFVCVTIPVIILGECFINDYDLPKQYLHDRRTANQI